MAGEHDDDGRKRGRPRKAKVDWFPHEVRRSVPLEILKKKFGVSGYCLWLILREKLGDSPGHFLDCDDDVTWEYLVTEAEMEEEKTLAILNLLVRLKLLDEILWVEKGVIWSKYFVDSIARLYDKRQDELPAPPDLSQFPDRKYHFPWRKLRKLHFPVSENTHSTGQYKTREESRGKGSLRGKTKTPRKKTKPAPSGPLVGSQSDPPHPTNDHHKDFSPLTSKIKDIHTSASEKSPEKAKTIDLPTPMSSAKPDCPDCKGTGYWPGTTKPCNCIMIQLRILEAKGQ